MLLRELFEAETKHVTFCFGRMNPPTVGHKQVLDTMKAQGGDMRIFVSQSQDPKKNPLDYETKVKFIKAMFPEYAGSVVKDAGLNTVVKVASYLHEQGYNAATFVAGSDRLEDMKKLLEQYNGVEGKAHGFYKFEVLDFVSSGDREDGAEGVAGVSASGARAAAANNDLEGFKEATGAGELAKPLFDAVRKGMKISESLDEIDRRGFLKGLGAAALAGTGMSAAASEGPLPVMATIKFKADDGTVKIIKKDLGHAYDYRLEDAKKDLENILDRKGIKNYTIHLDRYKDDGSSKDKNDKPQHSTAASNYMDKGPYTGQKQDKNYLDKSPYTVKKTTANYMDKASNKEFRDMDNY